jgi:hypothetical protein
MTETAPPVLSVGIELAYQVTCSRCGGALEGGLHDDLIGAIVDRRHHIRNHERDDEAAKDVIDGG